jgi:hypothetical protein
MCVPVRSLNIKEYIEMAVDEMLITGYYGDKTVFAVNVSPGRATVVLTHTNAQGETVVDGTWKRTTDVFIALRDVLDGLVAAQPEPSGS